MSRFAPWPEDVRRDFPWREGISDFRGVDFKHGRVLIVRCVQNKAADCIHLVVSLVSLLGSVLGARVLLEHVGGT